MNILTSLPVRLLLGVAVGIGVGLNAGEALMQVILTVKNLLGNLIMFCVPLIIIGFIAPSITRLGKQASVMLRIAIILAYCSSVGAALFATAAGYSLIPFLNITPTVDGLKEVPKLLFDLQIAPIMSVMSALVLSILLGLAATWTKAEVITKFLEEFQQIVLEIVTRIIITILPVFIACTFCALSYEGSITKQLPVFLIVVVIVMAGHYIWLTLLYLLAGAYAGHNPLRVIENYGPAYLTAVGTMSSAATLAIALKCALRSPVLRKDLVNFGIPLFANIHLCGSVLTEVFFVMVVSQVLYGTLPTLGTMILFCALLGIFAIGAPGVPGGTVMASLGLITSVLGFDATGTALMLTIFALQDSFGTACNVTGDGALTLMLTGYAKKNHIEEVKNVNVL